MNPRNNPIDISVYKVVMSQEVYDPFWRASETFHYEGRAKAIAKASAGIFGTPFGLLGGAVVGIVGVAGILGGAPNSGEEMVIKGARLATTSMKYAKKAVGHYGYSCNQSISLEWIAGKVDSNGAILLSNPEFKMSDPNNPIIYVLDAKNPETVLTEGLTYTHLGDPMGNKMGKIIFFHNLKHAFQCAALRDGRYFDAVGGWRRYHEWTAEERDRLHHGSPLKKEITTNTTLSTDVVEIVGEYLGAQPTCTLRK